MTDLQVILAKLDGLGCRTWRIEITDCTPTLEQMEALRRSLGPDEWVVEARTSFRRMETPADA